MMLRGLEVVNVGLVLVYEAEIWVVDTWFPLREHRLLWPQGLLPTTCGAVSAIVFYSTQPHHLSLFTTAHSTLS